MNVHFSKYHGTGNDFILIDGRDIDISGLDSGVIHTFCDRRFGIGADGMIILLPGEDVDFRMKYFNSDGKEGTMCGNGGRCITAFAKNLGIIENEAHFKGIDGLHQAALLSNGDIKLKLKDVEGISTLEDGLILDTGSPHFVKFVQNTDKTDVSTEGKRIRHEARFQPGGINVNFVQRFHGRNHIKVRTFERGVEAETLSCGTGVAASAISSYFQEKSDNFSYLIEAKGGELSVSFKPGPDNSFSELYLTGPATHVFEGNIKL